MEETWVPVRDFEGLYEISDIGRVKSLPTMDWRGRVFKERILTNSKTRSGYTRVVLYKDGIRNERTIHRLVASAFLENPNNYPCVNHKNEIKDDNRVGNLEWCDQAYNNNYGTCNYRQARTKGRKVAQYSQSGEFVADYFSISEATRRTGFSTGAICRGLNEGAITNNYLWKDTREVKIYA